MAEVLSVNTLALLRNKVLRYLPTMPSSVQHLERSTEPTVYFLSANKGLRETLWHFFLGKNFSDLNAFLKSEFGERLKLNSVNRARSFSLL